MLFTRTTGVLNKQISFLNIKATSMMVILKYLYTGFVLEKDITTDRNENELPELVSKAVQLRLPLTDNEIINYLVDSVAKISLDSIMFDRLSLQGLQLLLLKRDEKKIFVSNEYSVFRFAVLAAATKVSREAFSTMEERLPPWREIKGSLEAIKYNDPLENKIHTSIANIVDPITRLIDFRKIHGTILARIIEPLGLVPSDKINDSYRFQASMKISRSIFNENPTIRWDRNGCGPSLEISDDGYTVCAFEQYAAHQSMRTNYLMSEGTYEFHVLIEELCYNSWVDVCGEGLDFSQFAGAQPWGWVLGSHEYGQNGNICTANSIDSAINQNAKIVVHLDMNNKTVSFSINDKRQPPITSWVLSSNLYFVISLRYSGKFRILLPRK
ncbi:10879_t:CDS:2 [Acaulospora morrowiae]|uniref:10879_t:CDS:1 n=1 Tax=Acaulospora morrowiae TaxID=94023 RepID=A0A9N9CTI8_9GLOM|nr:10879_t:CDS:2 [Acaulospora morrowiae]